MSLASEMALDMAAAIADHEQTFEWEGVSYRCVRNPEPTASIPDEGGDVESLAERILVATNAARTQMIKADGTTGTAGLPSIKDGIDDNAKQIKMIEFNTAQLILHVDGWDK